MEVLDLGNTRVVAAVSVAFLLLVGACAYRNRFTSAFLLLILSLVCSFTIGLAPVLISPTPGPNEYLQAAVGTMLPVVAAFSLLAWINQSVRGAALWFWIAAGMQALTVWVWYF